MYFFDTEIKNHTHFQKVDLDVETPLVYILHKVTKSNTTLNIFFLVPVLFHACNFQDLTRFITVFIFEKELG